MSTKQRNYFRTGNIARFLLCDLIKRTLSAMLRFKRSLKEQTGNQRIERTLESRVALSNCPYVHLAICDSCSTVYLFNVSL